MYLQNKYTIWYNNIIQQAKSRDLPKETYTEKHHIIPKSLGGDNSDSNLVTLTAREHFICHLLLPRMLIGVAKRNMTFAIWSMLNRDHSKQQSRYKVNSHTYQRLKIQVSNASSQLHKGKTVSAETRAKISAKAKGRKSTFKGKSHSAESKEKLSIARKGKINSLETVAKILESRKHYRHSEETKQKISESNKGKIVVITKETKQKISNALKGRPSPLKGRPSPLKGKQASAELIQRYKDGHKNREIVTCPHCNKTLTKQNYNRWHGDRCKNK